MSKKILKTKNTKLFVKDDRDEIEENKSFSDCLIPYVPQLTKSTKSTQLSLTVQSPIKSCPPKKPLPPLPNHSKLEPIHSKSEIDCVSSMNKEIIITSGHDEKQWVIYFRELKKWQDKMPGVKIALMYNMGTFYEFFGIENEEEQIGNIYEICECANLNLSKVGCMKNPDLNDNDREHPLKGGFPVNGFDDFMPKIVGIGGFTVVIIDQTGKTVVTCDKNGNNKRETKERAFQRIISPSTYIDNPEATTFSMFTVSIYIAINTKESKKEHIRLKGWKDCLFSIGMSALDWSTGGDDSIIYEAHDTAYDETFSMNELYRFLHTFNPKEVVITYKSLFEFDDENANTELTEASFQDFLRKELELNKFKVPVFGKMNPHFIDVNYQSALLKSVYPKTGLLSVVSYLDLDMKIYACSSFVQILQFAYDRDPKIVSRLDKPRLWSTNKHLSLSCNAMYQMHLLHANRSDNTLYQPGLLDIIDKTKTAIGKRMLKHDILNPIMNVNELNARYNTIEMLQSKLPQTPQLPQIPQTPQTNNNENDKLEIKFIFSEIRRMLTNIADIERMNRQLEISDIRPNVLVKMYQSYVELIKLVDWMKGRSELSNLWTTSRGECEDDKNEDVGDNRDEDGGGDAGDFKIKKYILSSKSIEQLRKFVAHFNRIINIEKMQKYINISRVEESLFKKGAGFTEIDELQSKIESTTCSSENFTQILSNLIDKDSKNCTIELKKLKSSGKAKKTLFAMNCSKARYKIIDHYSEAIKIAKSETNSPSNNTVSDNSEEGEEEIKIFKYDGIKAFNKLTKKSEDENGDCNVRKPKEGEPTLSLDEIKYIQSICNINREKLKDKVQFESNIIHESKDETTDLHVQMNELMKIAYKSVLEGFAAYVEHFHMAARFVGRIDIFANHAYIATKYIYNKPCISECPISQENGNCGVNGKQNGKDDGKDDREQSSFIVAKQMRHPIIERLLVKTAFVPNDLKIGFDNTNGILLFGINNVGKTSYIRSVGLCVILAQIGAYVPAESFNFYPFQHILTRLSGHDNMYKGQGSFEVEMSELRDICNRCTKRSLVLADELCHGTEQGTANGIVTGGIVHLSKKTNFILTTHLHDTPNQPELADITNIKYMHLHTTRDIKTNKIIYDRKLQDGPGDSNYGIEVARANDVQEDILRVAESVRKRYMGEDNHIVSTKTSRYGSAKYMTKCLVCGETSQETHHIQEQQDANELGHIGFIHKNHLSNLLPLCQICHNEVSMGRLEILSPIVTTDGIEFPIKRIKEMETPKQKTLLDYVKTI